LLAARGLGVAYTEQTDTALVKAFTLMGQRQCYDVSSSSTELSPDGSLVLVVNRTSTSQILDAKTGKLRFVLQQDRPASRGYFSKDGKTVLTLAEYDDQGSVYVWSVDTGRQMQVFSIGRQIRGFPFLPMD
jgi:WD40 repeat protein